MSKEWYKSKTIWLGIFGILFAVAKTFFPEYTSYVNPEGETVGVVMGLLGVILRFNTDKPLKTPGS